MFFCDISQHVLFAQHVGAQAFSLGLFDSTHAGTAGRIEATSMATVSADESMILLGIR